MTKPANTTPVLPPEEVTQMVKHFFRHESGKTEYGKRFTCYSTNGTKPQAAST